jgi:hypothetical protein
MDYEDQFNRKDAKRKSEMRERLAPQKVRSIKASTKAQLKKLKDEANQISKKSKKSKKK